MSELESTFGLLLGLDDKWKVASVDLQTENKRVVIRVEWNGGKPMLCPECGKHCAFYDLRAERSWRHLDTMQFETIIRCSTPRCKCQKHGVHTINNPWAGPYGRFTLMFEALAIRVMEACTTVKAACGLLGISWHQADEIRRRAVERGMSRRQQQAIDYVGLDEKSFGKHHDYISVLTDISGSRVLDVVAERKQKSAEKLLRTLSRKQRKNVMAAAVDMWPGFMNAVEKHLPEAVLVHDKFHVCKHLNESVDKVRKLENRQLVRNGDDRLKGSKFLFLKRPEKLKKSSRERFEQLRHSGLKVARAWSIKEQFDEFWTFEFRSDAEAFFEYWYNWAVRSRLKAVKEVAQKLKKHLSGLLGYIIHSITNAVTEGFNSKIQNIKACARGFRSFDRYRIAILFYCGKLSMMPDIGPVPQNS